MNVPELTDAPVTTAPAAWRLPAGERSPDIPDRYRWLWWIIGALALVAAALSLAALFPDYYDAGESLSDTAAGVWFNLPAGDQDAGPGVVLGLFGIGCALVATGIAVVLLVATGGRLNGLDNTSKARRLALSRRPYATTCHW
jgi:hypothetical protein